MAAANTAIHRFHRIRDSAAASRFIIVQTRIARREISRSTIILPHPARGARIPR
jgi:hypothetical protein